MAVLTTLTSDPTPALGLYDEVCRLWDADDRALRLATEWIRDHAVWLPRLEELRRGFRIRTPLRGFISLGDAKRSRPIVSIRFRGQEVAFLHPSHRAGDAPRLEVMPRHKDTNERDFAYHECPVGTFGWRSSKATAFRSHFQAMAAAEDLRPARERNIEARILAEMTLSSVRKFQGSLRDIQPVLLAGLPFQCPVPFSANEGEPRPTRGNIDILARRGTGASTRLSIWELKRPGQMQDALRQAYVYAVTLARVLRSPVGPDWYKCFGFGRRLPAELLLEVVVAVTEDKLSTVKQHAEELLVSAPLDLPKERARIALFAAIYDRSTMKIDMRALAAGF